MASLYLLHISDPHLSTMFQPLDDVDIKLQISEINPTERRRVMDRSLRAAAAFLQTRGAELSGTLITGDAVQGGLPADPTEIDRLLSNSLGKCGWTRAKTVVVPGNHDIKFGSDPSTVERYELFQSMWRQEDYDYVTPLLEGIDGRGDALSRVAARQFRKHALIVEPLPGHDASPIVVIPINSSNWSQVALPQRPQLQAVIAAGVEKIGNPDSEENRKLKRVLESLLVHDVARVSSDQRDAISALLNSARSEGKVDDNTITIAILHHQLLPVGATEEIKTFETMTNLGALRQFLGTQGIDIVVHGHKHIETAYVDHVETEGTNAQILVISGGSYSSEPNAHVAPCRVLEIAGLPFNPQVIVRPISVPLQGGSPVPKWVRDGAIQQLRPLSRATRAPIVVSDFDIDRLYSKVRKIAAQPDVRDGGRTIITHFDILESLAAGESRLPFPKNYDSEVDQSPDWVNEVVRWWQLSASHSQDRVPYIHGVRLYRYNGFLDQIQRIINLLDTAAGRTSAASGRTMADAIAVLLDPLQDLEDVAERTKRGYLAFCLLQFVHRKDDYLDVIAYYRVQEFNYWWPVNLAELVFLLKKVASHLNSTLRPGSVTTVTPIAQFSQGKGTPTRVALPLLDQLLDYAPHALAHMMDALSRPPAEWDAHDQEVIDRWRACLRDLRIGAMEYNELGNPVAIKGIEFILNYLKANPGKDGSRRNTLCGIVQRLLDVNDRYENSGQRRRDFSRWQLGVQTELDKLEGLL